MHRGRPHPVERLTTAMVRCALSRRCEESARCVEKRVRTECAALANPPSSKVPNSCVRLYHARKRKARNGHSVHVSPVFASEWHGSCVYIDRLTSEEPSQWLVDATRPRASEAAFSSVPHSVQLDSHLRPPYRVGRRWTRGAEFPLPYRTLSPPTHPLGVANSKGWARNAPSPFFFGSTADAVETRSGREESGAALGSNCGTGDALRASRSVWADHPTAACPP